jgi:putative flavoprotein involved in K+ transport
MIEKIETLIVGGGQAGIAMSEHLSNYKIPHLVLERNRIAERWRSERWDTLVANGPAWHDRFPNMEFTDFDPNGFPSKEQVVDYFVAYAEMIKAPIRCGVEVKEVRRNVGRPGFRIETSDGIFEANNVVAATGPFQCPIIPDFKFESNRITQIHSSQYHNPDQLPDGGVLVIGAGSSGSQIADELLRTGKSVHLSVGPHDLPPRSYRGRDFVWWLGVLGKWEAVTKDPGTEHITIAVSGAHGGQTVDFRGLAERGIILLGRTHSVKKNVMHFEPDLAKNIANGNSYTLSLLDQADEYVIRNGLDFPLEPEAREVLPDPDCVKNPILEIDLKEAGIN